MKRATDAELIAASMTRVDVVDAKNAKKKTRHLAILNYVAAPGFDMPATNGVANLEVAATVCGKILKNYRDGQCSYFFADGSRYSTPCPNCLSEDYENFQANTGEVAQ